MTDSKAMTPKEEIADLRTQLTEEKARRETAEKRVTALEKWFGENRVEVCLVKELREMEARAMAAEAMLTERPYQ